MARARLLKPGFFSNEHLADVSIAGRLLFAGLWTIADREGRLEDRPKRIKGELFRYESIDVESLLTELVNQGFIDRYEVEGIGYIQVLRFKEHQKPHQNEPPSTIPPSPSTNGTSARAVAVGVPPDEAAAAAGQTLDEVGDGNYRTVCDHWLAQTGTTLSRKPAEMLVAAAERTSLAWVKDAIDEGMMNNVRTPNYVLAIISRWESEGREKAKRIDPDTDDLDARKARYLSGPIAHLRSAK